MLPRFAYSAVALVLLALLACSNQGEGERCSQLASNSGNDDCQDGLICVPAAALTNGMGFDACCPVDRTQATTTICSLNKTTGIDAGIFTPDAGADSFVAPPVDAGQDAQPPVDAGQDAPVDSPASSG